MGHDVLYSGTVGAALTAQLLGVPAIAISLDNHPGETLYWEAAEAGLHEALEVWLKQPAHSPVVLNVNVPNRPANELAGVRVTTLGSQSFLTHYTFEDDPLYAATLRAVPQKMNSLPEPEPGTDEWAVAHGYISLTPLRPFHELLRAVPWNTTRRLRTPVMTAHEFKSAPDMVYLADR
jgi:5'-nucleotidase